MKILLTSYDKLRTTVTAIPKAAEPAILFSGPFGLRCLQQHAGLS